MRIGEVLSNPFVVSLGSVIGTLLFTKIPEKIIESFTTRGKIKKQRQEESLAKVYLPIFRVIYNHQFYKNVTYEDICDFSEILDRHIKENIITVPPTILGKALSLKRRIAKTNSKRKGLDFITKNMFSELKSLLLHRYYLLRRKFYYQEIGTKEIFDSLSTINLLLTLVYFISVIIGAVAVWIMQCTKHSSLPMILIAVIAFAVFVSVIIVMIKIKD